jgi:hypothetical protein
MYCSLCDRETGRGRRRVRREGLGEEWTLRRWDTMEVPMGLEDSGGYKVIIYRP